RLVLHRPNRNISQARKVGRLAPRRQARHRWARCPARTCARAGQVQIMHSILEIISEAPESAGPDLVSLDDLKLALGIEDTTEDAALQAAITFQSRIIAEYCNRRFGLAQAVETFTFDRYENMLRRQALTL